MGPKELIFLPHPGGPPGGGGTKFHLNIVIQSFNNHSCTRPIAGPGEPLLYQRVSGLMRAGQQPWAGGKVDAPEGMFGVQASFGGSLA